MDRTLTRRALALMDAHQEFARASVVKTVGSVPGKLGATLLLTAGGVSYGTVGGAALEEQVKALAAEAIRTRSGGLHHFDLQAWKPGGLPSLCGGSVDIAIEYVPVRPHLLLWGGGHVAQALSVLLPSLEYDFSVADDRAEWANPARFPAAERCEVVDPDRLWEVFEPAEYTHLYVLGYDARKDTQVLQHSVSRYPNFIGLIASGAKRIHVFAELRARGLTERELERIRSPIGVPIGAESPAEIAVSVAAEIIQSVHPSGPTDHAERQLAREPDVHPNAP
jgi:xanthine dehydrogenase accessory factor